MVARCADPDKFCIRTLLFQSLECDAQIVDIALRIFGTSEIRLVHEFIIVHASAEELRSFPDVFAEILLSRIGQIAVELFPVPNDTCLSADVPVPDFFILLSRFPGDVESGKSQNDQRFNSFRRHFGKDQRFDSVVQHAPPGTGIQPFQMEQPEQPDSQLTVQEHRPSEIHSMRRAELPAVPAPPEIQMGGVRSDGESPGQLCFSLRETVKNRVISRQSRLCPVSGMQAEVIMEISGSSGIVRKDPGGGSVRRNFQNPRNDVPVSGDRIAFFDFERQRCRLVRGIDGTEGDAAFFSEEGEGGIFQNRRFDGRFRLIGACLSALFQLKRIGPEGPFFAQDDRGIGAVMGIRDAEGKGIAFPFAGEFEVPSEAVPVDVLPVFRFL